MLAQLNVRVTSVQESCPTRSHKTNVLLIHRLHVCLHGNVSAGGEYIYIYFFSFNIKAKINIYYCVDIGRLNRSISVYIHSESNFFKKVFSSSISFFL